MTPELSADIRRLKVEPRLWGWYRRDYPPTLSEWADRPEVVIDHYQRAAGGCGLKGGPLKMSLAGILWASLVGFGHLVTAYFDPETGSWAEILVGMALSLTILRLARTPAGKLPLSVIMTLLAFTFFTTIGLGLFLLGAAPIAVIHLCRNFKRRRSSTATKRTRNPGPVFPLPSMIFGDPGGISKAAERYGVARVAAGAEGEKSTAKLLELLLAIPGTTVFHGLSFPGSRNADVDHAVVHGNQVILVDSKQFRDGLYSWAGNRSAIVNSQNRREYDNHMDAAREGYARLLGGEARVHSVVMIHGKAVFVGDSKNCNGVLLATAHDAMDHIGTLVAADLDAGGAGFDNSRIVGRLMMNLKSG